MVIRTLFFAAGVLAAGSQMLGSPAHAGSAAFRNPTLTRTIGWGRSSCPLLWIEDPDCQLKGAAYGSLRYQTRHSWAMLELPYSGHTPDLRPVASGGLRVGRAPARVLLGPSLDVATVGPTQVAPGASVAMELKPARFKRGQRFLKDFPHHTFRAGVRAQQWLGTDELVWSHFSELIWAPGPLGWAVRAERPALRPDDQTTPLRSQGLTWPVEVEMPTVPFDTLILIATWTRPRR